MNINTVTPRDISLKDEEVARLVAREAAHKNFVGLALPRGWEWDDEQMAEPTITWPQYELTAVIAAEDRALRKTLFSRFQLFDTSAGGFNPVIKTERFDLFLEAFDRSRGQALQAAE